MNNFASNAFASRHFASHVFRGETVVAPTPAPSTGGGGGIAKSGGYRGFMSKGIMLVDPTITGLNKAINLHECLKQEALKEPAIFTKKGKGKVKEYEFKVLKHRIKELDEELRQARLGSAEQLHLVEEVKYLKTKVAAFEAELTKLQAELAAERASHPIVRGLPWWTGSLIVGLASMMVLEGALLKWVGVSTAIVLAGFGLSAALSSASPAAPEEASEELVGGHPVQIGAINTSGIGVIRF